MTVPELIWLVNRGGWPGLILRMTRVIRIETTIQEETAAAEDFFHSMSLYCSIRYAFFLSDPERHDPHDLCRMDPVENSH